MPLYDFMWQYQSTSVIDFAQEMSALICPCGGTTGGGTVTLSGINDTNFIPVSDGSVLQNSHLYNTGDLLKTTFTPTLGDTIWGIELDYLNKTLLFGDHSSGIQVATDGGYANMYVLDPNGPVGNAVMLSFDAPAQRLFTEFGVGGSGLGFDLDHLNSVYAFGQFAGLGANPMLKADVGNSTIDMTLDGNGLNIFKLGLDVDGIVMNADETVTSAGLSGSYINVKVNGVAYKLALYLL